MIQRVDGGEPGPLASVTLTNVVIAGQPVADLGDLVAPPAFGLSLVNGVLRCVVSCGFGIVEGRYEFRISAPGYREKTVATTASYSTFDRRLSLSQRRRLSRGPLARPRRRPVRPGRTGNRAIAIGGAV